MTETEKYVKTAESRSVTKTEQEYEPEFAPFSFGQDKTDTAYEVEQPFTMEPLKTEVPAKMEMPVFKTTEEILWPTNNRLWPSKMKSYPPLNKNTIA